MSTSLVSSLTARVLTFHLQMVRRTAEERVDTDGANEYAMLPFYSPRPRQMIPIGSDPFGRANSMANRGMTTEDSA